MDSVEGKYAVMITVRGKSLAGATDVGVVALGEWTSGSFSAYIC